MSTQKNNQKGQKKPPKDDTQVSPQWLYDEIMRHIEPDLCSHQIPHLDTKYHTETPKEQSFRHRAYELAFSLFDVCLKEIKGQIADDVSTWKQRVRVQVKEHKERAQSDTSASTSS